MMPVERRILIKAASMYYLDHLKQSEIASRMGVDRTTISKYLKKAMKSGIVKIEVESDSYEDLEAALERRFGLREAYVVPKSYDMLAIKQSMAQAGLNHGGWTGRRHGVGFYHPGTHEIRASREDAAA